MRTFRSGPPTPEEFQRQLSEFMRQHFSNFPGAAQKPSAATSESDSDSGRQKGGDDDFAFDKKPRDIKAYLDRFVIRQDEAKKVLSVAMCDHYHHVRLALQGKEQP